jgi:hypothetical protein
VDLWDTQTLQPVGEPLTVPGTGFYPLANGPGTKMTVGSDRGPLSVVDVDPGRGNAPRAASPVATSPEQNGPTTFLVSRITRPVPSGHRVADWPQRSASVGDIVSEVSVVVGPRHRCLCRSGFQ